ncbi:acyl-CoA dehydrogenase family protein [Dietzia sp. B32]|uniref:acyl-CoA dehydrogenase family protein n=1 Tax=Dietzia sp. B32 TaxID=2915130 RepID=UPI0021AD54AA|nr:acyl-CoA dehydrogenase family protein [Dietzia sp. B32]UVE96907.1 acyl-CoA dehydrogenase family protein [Dietzia sp. B32]
MGSADLARAWIREGRADLPLPARGDTRTRWAELTAMCTHDIAAGRLVEAHADADAILAEIEGTRVGRDELWGVWAAEPPMPVLTARRPGDGSGRAPGDGSGRAPGDGWVLDGVKSWCSGGDVCTHALVTALDRDDDDDDEPRLFAVDLRHPGVAPRADGWANPGMAGSRTTAVEFTDVPARAVGDRRSYLDRPGFWHGGVGVAACWLGAGIAVARPLLARATRPDVDPHTLAHLGGVDVALGGASWALDAAAAEIDRDGPDADLTAARHRAVRVRAMVEAAVDETIRRVGRALGPAPLAMDPRHAQNVSDAQVYIRQFHAEHDLAGLGATARTHGGWAW